VSNHTIYVTIFKELALAAKFINDRDAIENVSTRFPISEGRGNGQQGTEKTHV
jgi:hypothetical protein